MTTGRDNTHLAVEPGCADVLKHFMVVLASLKAEDVKSALCFLFPVFP